MFIRIKRVYGKKYAYLVKNTWTPKGSRQKVAKYLGSFIEMQDGNPITFAQFIGANPEEYFKHKNFKEVTLEALRYELLRRGFNDTETEYSREEIKVSKNDFTSSTLLKMNRGYYCQDTFNELLSYNGTEDPTGKHLARLILGAGISENEDIFLELFTKSHQDKGDVVIEY